MDEPETVELGDLLVKQQIQILGELAQVKNACLLIVGCMIQSGQMRVDAQTRPMREALGFRFAEASQILRPM